MRFFLLLLVSSAFLSIEHPADAASLKELRASVFKILVTSASPDFGKPWSQEEPDSSNGTGFYIGDDQILTNAHVVANASYIAVLRDGDAAPIPAKVRFIGHDCDLAILKLEDPKVFSGLKPLKFGGLPKLQSSVATIGFPSGGEQISITEGVVSRISYRRYVHHGSASHLLVQVDSAINPGNSGGPVLQGRFVVGVAFQSFTRAENTGYIIPVPVIERFLKDLEDGVYDGHPKDGLTTMDWSLLNPSTAAFYGLKSGDGGTKLAAVAPWALTSSYLKEGDILLAMDGRKIGVDGKLEFQGERVDFRTLFDLKLKGDIAAFKVLRDGQINLVEVPIGRVERHHEPELIYAKHPRYFVWGGLVFTRLSRSLLRSWGDRWYRDAPLLLRFFDVSSQFEEETKKLNDLIVFLKILPDSINAYSSQNIFGIVKSVDGQIIHSFEELVAVLETGTSEFIVLEFHGSQSPLVMTRQSVKERNHLILSKYRVSPDRWLDGPEMDGAISLP